MRRELRSLRKQGGWVAALAGLASAAVSAFGAYRANKGSQDFSRDMSGTAHQREVADLRAAGLNPILSGTGGMGANTPPAQFSNVGEAAASGFMAARANKAQVELMEDQGKKAREEAAVATAAQAAQTHLGRLYENQTMGTILDNVVKRSRINSGVVDAENARDKASAKAVENAAGIEADIDSGKVGEWTRILNRLLPGTNSASGAARALRR